MTVQVISPNAGPTLVLGDCLAAVVTIYKADDGEFYGDCPTCGTPSTDTTAQDGGPVTVQEFAGTYYIQGGGVLVPCGHEVGAIEVRT